MVLADGTIIKDPLLRDEVVLFFQNLIVSSTQIDHEEATTLLENIPNRLVKEKNDFLLKPPFSEDEIKRVVLEMAGDKAPSPEGFPAFLF